MFRGPPYTGRIEDLPKRLQNAYNKRREENLLHHQLSSVAADAEARVHVSRMLYIEQQRRANKAAQMKMFDAAPCAKCRGGAEPSGKAMAS